MQQRPVLFVRFYVERLVAILGNFGAQLGDAGLVLATRGFIGFKGGLRFVELGFRSGESRLDRGYSSGELGDFVLQTADFLIHVLQFQKILYFRKHCWRSCIDFSTRRELKSPALRAYGWGGLSREGCRGRKRPISSPAVNRARKAAAACYMQNTGHLASLPRE